MKFKILFTNDAYYVAAQTRELCDSIGFSKIQSSSICVVVSELANNIFKYARMGEIIVEQISGFGRKGIQIVAQDEGPGISNWEEALKDGYSSKNTLGLGLPGIVRLVDEFEYDRERKVGVKIQVRKWLEN